MEETFVIAAVSFAVTFLVVAAFVSVVVFLARESTVPPERSVETPEWKDPLTAALGVPTFLSAKDELSFDIDGVALVIRPRGAEFAIEARCGSRDITLRANEDPYGSGWDALDAISHARIRRFAELGGSIVGGRVVIGIADVRDAARRSRDVTEIVRLLASNRAQTASMLRRVSSADDPGRVSIAVISENAGTLTEPGAESKGALSKRHPLSVVTRVWAASGEGEDRVLAILVGESVVIVVADGAGGTGGGAAAAEKILARTQQVGAALVSGVYAPAELLAELDRALAPTGGQAAATIAVVSATQVFGACAGDVEALYEVGGTSYDLTAERRRKPLLGSGEVEPVVFGQEGAGRLLVATDGLFSYAKREPIREILASASIESAPDRLVELVRLRSGELQDDVGLAIVVPAP